MTIREIIARLEKIAAEHPRGLELVAHVVDWEFVDTEPVDTVELHTDHMFGTDGPWVQIS